MKPIIVTIGLAFLALAAPATEARSGVSAEVRRACEMQAEKVRPALRAGEKESLDRQLPGRCDGEEG